MDADGNRIFDREDQLVTDTNEDGIIDNQDTPQYVIVGGAYSPGWQTNTYIPTERWDAGQYLQVKVTFRARINGRPHHTRPGSANVQTPLITAARSAITTLDKADTEELITDAISDAEESVTIPDQFDDTLLVTIPTNLSAWLPNLGGGVGLRWSATVGRQSRQRV